MNWKKSIKMLVVIMTVLCTSRMVIGQAVAKEEEKMVNSLDVFELESLSSERKVAYLTFDDGPSIYTTQLLDVLKAYDIPAIFFVLGNQLKYMPNADELLQRIVDDGHFLALHTMTHDLNALYRLEKSSTQFIDEMFELRNEFKVRVGWETNLCRAPYGRKGHFKAAHYQAVAEAGLYCVDWHIDSRDWEVQTADAIYAQVVKQLEDYPNQQEIVILMHEYQRTVDALPRIIELLKAKGFTFAPYVEGKIFTGLE